MRENVRVKYVDPGLVAAMMTDKHRRKRINWGNVLGWVSLGVMVLSFWWWALFC